MLRWLLLSALLLATAALTACSLVPPEPTPEPIEREPFFPEAMTTTVELDVTTTAVVAEWGYQYWISFGDDLFDCVQRVRIEGSVVTGGFDGCAECGARMTFDSSSAVDISDPTNDPFACDPRYLLDTGWRLGFEPLVATVDGGRGDLLDIGWYPPAAHAASGVDFTANGGLTFETLSAVAQSRGHLYSGGLLTRTVSGTLAEAIGVDGVGNGPEAGSDWRGWAFITRDPITNGSDGAELLGRYEGQGFWVIQFAAAEEPAE